MVENKPFDQNLLSETEKTANRGFTTAFLLSASERSTERFDSSAGRKIYHRYTLGKLLINVLKVGWKWMSRIGLKSGHEMEYISPLNNYRFCISSMENKSGLALKVAHGGNGTVWIKTEGQIDPFGLLSRIVDAPVSSSAS